MSNMKKLKILMCGIEYPPKGSGIAYLIYYLEKTWRKMGHKVEIHTPTFSHLKKNVFSAHLFSHLGGIGVLYFWFQASSIVLKGLNKYDLIYLHNPYLFRRIESNNVFCVIHTLYKFSHTSNSSLFLKFYLVIMTFFERTCFSLMRNLKFVVTSPETEENLRYFGLVPLHPVIFNGVELNPDIMEKKQIINSNPTLFKKLVFVGRLHIQKNPLSLLATFQQLKLRDNTFKLTIVGDGPLRKRMEKFVRINYIQDVTFLGKVNRETLETIYLSHDFLIMASSYEGFPLVLSEALGHGLVPLLSAIPIYQTVRETIGEGLIVDFNHPSAASIKIIKYVEGLDLKKTSVRIMEQSRKIFAWETIAKQYLSLGKDAP